MDSARDTAVRGGAVPPLPPHSSAQFSSTGTGRRAVPPRDPPPARPSLSQFIGEVRAAFGARFYLLELEAKRAAWSAAYMLGFAVAAALLAVTAWLILMGALIYGAVAAGLPWVIAAVVAIALHALGAFLLVRAIQSTVENLTFAATRRTLAKADSAAQI